MSLENVISNYNLYSSEQLNFEDASEEILTKITNLDLTPYLPHFATRKLFITRPRMRQIVRQLIYASNNQFFKEIGYERYDYQNGADFNKVSDLVESIIRILALKQKMNLI